jgi:hypothetical protein
MPLYDADARLSDDKCAIITRLRDNQSMIAYRLFDPHAVCSKDCKERQTQLKEFATDHPMLQFRDGFGLSPCDVDGDSDLRNNAAWTNPKCRQQLPARVFGAAPDLSRGLVRPNTESVLVQGQDTTILRQCGRKLSEVDYNRFGIGIDVQCADHVVPPWQWGGESSRDIARSREFLESIGYKLDQDSEATCYAAI